MKILSATISFVLVALFSSCALKADGLETRAIDGGTVKISLHDKNHNSITIIKLASQQAASGSSLFKSTETGLYSTIFESYKIVKVDAKHVDVGIHLKTLDPVTGDVLEYAKTVSIIDYSAVVLAPYKGINLQLNLIDNPPKHNS